jgi:hypothetical protein
VAAQTGTLEKMLLLTRGIFCANLLTVDTLDGKTLIVFLGAELDERRVNFLVDGTTHVHDERSEEIDGERTTTRRREEETDSR